MKLGRTEILLVILLICGVVWLGAQYLPMGGPKACAPLPLSEQVRQYIDKKILSGNSGAQCGDIPKLVARVAELEAKLSEVERFRRAREELEVRRERFEGNLRTQKREQQDVFERMRQAELARLRANTATMCAGITIVPNRERRAQEIGLDGANKDEGGSSAGER